MAQSLSTEQQEPANPVEMIEETSGGNVEIDIPGNILEEILKEEKKKGGGRETACAGDKQDARLQDTGVQRRSQPAFARIESQGQRERHCGEISKIQGTGLYFLKRSELVCPCRQLPKPGGSGVRACRTEAGIPAVRFRDESGQKPDSSGEIVPLTVIRSMQK